MTVRRFLLSTAGVVAALAVALVVGFTAAVASFGATAAGSDNSATFTDPAGDSQGALDITAVGITYTETTGMVSIGVTTTGALLRALASGAPTPAITPPPPATVTTNIVSVNLDADANASTGPGGYEYMLKAQRGGGNLLSWDVSNWDGATWKSIRTSSINPISFSNSGNVYTWTISRADLANTSRFAFAASATRIVSSTSGSTSTSDHAPDSGQWTFDLSPPPPPPATTTTAPAIKPLIGEPATTPVKPVAGKRFTVVFPVTRSDTGAPLTNGTMICDPSVAGKVIPHSEQFKNGKAALAFTVPRAAKGKQLKVKLKITTSGGRPPRSRPSPFTRRPPLSA